MAKKKNKNSNENKKGFTLRGVLIFLIGTFGALIPQYIIRSSHKIYYYLSHHLKTYPGDLWYCWDHYIAKGFPYPVEYPAGIQLIYRFIWKMKPYIMKINPKLFTYEVYFICICIFLALFAMAVTAILYHIIKVTHGDVKRLWWLWIFSPTFLLFGLLNLDFPAVFTIMVAYYLFIEEEYYLAAAMLALGTAMKVFPIFLTPLFYFACPKKFSYSGTISLKFFETDNKFFKYEFEREEDKPLSLQLDWNGKRLFGFAFITYGVMSVVTFIFMWLLFNVPFMLSDWGAWIFPYRWQITHNFAKSAQDGSWWWIAYKALEGIKPGMGKWAGKLSLLTYASLYFIFLKKRWNLPLARRCAGIIILFLLTDRIYSPQYNLYLLPFLVLMDIKVNKLWFYISEIGITQVLFLFFVKNKPDFYPGLWLQVIVFIKYAALIMILRQIWTEPVQEDVDEEYNRYHQAQLVEEDRRRMAEAKA